MLIVVQEIDEIEDDSNADIPREFVLQQNYPNPFNPMTRIHYGLPKTSHVKIEIYDIVGQKVETLVNQPMEAGKHEVEFYADNLPSGIYFYRLQAGKFNDVKKMILLK
jgi:hypothetical protein